jgi:four helix bundle protein
MTAPVQQFNGSTVQQFNSSTVQQFNVGLRLNNSGEGNMSVKNFEDLNVWKEARKLTREIYQITKTEKFFKDFSLRDQIRRAAISVMSNIAEGFERGGNQEFVQFLYVAKASCGEVRSQLYVAVDQGYATPAESEKLLQLFMRLSSMIANLIAYLRKSDMKGEKFARSKPAHSEPVPR